LDFLFSFARKAASSRKEVIPNFQARSDDEIVAFKIILLKHSFNMRCKFLFADERLRKLIWAS
jgi:hypothetical protein